ncbi:hypothetical protein MUP65_01180 [Patescibacteria group bacterium]|nr:hypothetical protein [Patescibacteria group bacterium]
MSKKQSGQALLPLLIVLVISVSLATLAIEMSISSILIDRTFLNSLVGYYSVESVLENAFIRWLRDPGYEGETIEVNGLDCQSTVTGTSPWLFEASCQADIYVRKMSAQVSWVDGEMVIEDFAESR